LLLLGGHVRRTATVTAAAALAVLGRLLPLVPATLPGLVAMATALAAVTAIGKIAAPQRMPLVETACVAGRQGNPRVREALAS
jgi:hypothetical protein